NQLDHTRSANPFGFSAAYCFYHNGVSVFAYVNMADGAFSSPHTYFGYPLFKGRACRSGPNHYPFVTPKDNFCISPDINNNKRIFLFITAGTDNPRYDISADIASGIREYIGNALIMNTDSD